MGNFIEILALMIVGILTSLLFCVVSALIVWPLWNWLMPVIFGLCTINYWQSLGLCILTTLLLRFNISSKKD